MNERYSKSRLYLVSSLALQMASIGASLRAKSARDLQLGRASAQRYGASLRIVSVKRLRIDREAAHGLAIEDHGVAELFQQGLLEGAQQGRAGVPGSGRSIPEIPRPSRLGRRCPPR